MGFFFILFNFVYSVQNPKFRMNHADHVRLLKSGIPMQGGVWADLGSGTGAFTLALAELIGPTGEIYSVDQDAGALAEQQRAFQRQFPQMRVMYLKADFTRPLKLPELDGIVMANSLHFHRHKQSILQRVKSYLRPEGRLLMVEYNTDKGNVWVPHPMSFGTWQSEAQQAGFAHTELIATRPSSFRGEFFAAASY